MKNYEINQVIISADELIEGGKKKKTFAHQAYKEGEKVVFADLKIGDYVVHKKLWNRNLYRSKHNNSRWNNKRLYKTKISK